MDYNLLGQRLGRKGRGTRERILSAVERLLAGSPDTAISLSAVAREASLGMTTLYLYFNDLTELLLAVLQPVMASAEESYIGQLRCRWPDEALSERGLRFVEAYHAFWVCNSRLLHLRNSLADNNDERMRLHRISVAEPVIRLLAQQMDDDPDDRRSPSSCISTVLMTSIERLSTVTTDARFPQLMTGDPTPQVRGFLAAQARILELSIADRRAAARATI